jgi:hypothetical protein
LGHGGRFDGVCFWDVKVSCIEESIAWRWEMRSCISEGDVGSRWVGAVGMVQL